MPPFQMRSSTDGTRSVAWRSSAQPSSEGVNASSEEGLGNPPFFWQFVKSALDTPSCLEMVELLGAPAFSTRSSPSMAAFPAAFFIACGRPNHERSPLPLLTVLLLLTGEHQEEGDWASNEGTQKPLGCGHLRGLFLPTHNRGRRCSQHHSQHSSGGWWHHLSGADPPDRCSGLNSCWIWMGVNPSEPGSQRRGRDSNPRQKLPPVTP